MRNWKGFLSRTILGVATFALAAATVLADPVVAPSQAFGNPQPIPERYVVVFKDTVANPPNKAVNLMRGSHGELHFTYSHAIKGFAATIPAAAYQAIRMNPNVDYIEQDFTVSLRATQDNATWGLDRIDQRFLPLDGKYRHEFTGADTYAFIIDTGIRADHAEFAGRVEAGFTAIAEGGTDDCNGHGTHVAGTVGGTVYGVAKEVTLIPVRVLDCNGSGTLSGVIAGVDWVAGQSGKRPAVANMSLGGGASSSLDGAVANAHDAGVTMVVAAGNDNADACSYSPAREPSAITVGSTTSADERSGFSNYGSCVNVFAPGSRITSAYHTGTSATAVMSGTSMASPHVAGVAALLLEQAPAASPDEVRAAILDSATQDIVTASLSAANDLLYSLVSLAAAAPSEPSVTTGAVSNISDTSAAASGEVSDSGSATVTDRGVCYGVSSEDSGNWACLSSGQGLGDFTISLSNLDPGTDYGFQAFATNSVGTALGGVRTFTTLSADLEAPRITAFSVTDTSGGPWTRADVDWTVTDDVALARLELELLDGDRTVASESITVSGVTASGSTSLRNRGAAQAVRLTVSDAAGHVTTETKPLAVDEEPIVDEEPVNDDDPPPSDGFVLSGQGYKIKGAWTADLSWSGSEAQGFRILRNGTHIATVEGGSSYTDATSFKGGGSLVYQVCESATDPEVCSNELTVDF